MSQLWKTWSAKYAALQRRERIMVLGMVLVCIVFLGNVLLIEPMLARKKTLLEQTASDTRHVGQLQQQIAVLVQQSQVDPDAANKARMAELQGQLQVAEGLLNTLRQGFVTPEKMPQLLDGLLKKNGQLKLVELKTLPASTLPMPENAKVILGSTANAASTVINDMPVFRHGVELTVEGRYLEVLNYLTSLEQLPWGMLWSRAVLKAGVAGTVSLTLTVYTLSLDKTWLSL